MFNLTTDNKLTDPHPGIPEPAVLSRVRTNCGEFIIGLIAASTQYSAAVEKNLVIGNIKEE